MPSASVDSTFAGSIPELYERYLVPLIFEPYARDLSVRAARAIANRFARGAVDGKIQAHVVTAERPMS